MGAWRAWRGIPIRYGTPGLGWQGFTLGAVLREWGRAAVYSEWIISELITRIQRLWAGLAQAKLGLALAYESLSLCWMRG